VLTRNIITAFSVLCGVAWTLQACKKNDAPETVLAAEAGEEYSGGQLNTVFDVSGNAFSLVSPGLTGNDENHFFVGNSFFKLNWVEAPSSTLARDGLGPTLNARSCAACHFKDGRGAPPTAAGQLSTGLLMRISIPGTGPHDAPNPDPNYGDQLNDQSIPDVTAEGQISIAYTEVKGTFGDGEVYTLQSPTYTLVNPGYGLFGGGLMMSPRVGQQVIGLGLLEALSESDILSHADEGDADGDGISGKANYVWDMVAGKPSLGRFGWKANQPSLLQQTAGAFVGDMGITTYLFPNQNCTGIQTGCQNAADGGSPEMSDEDLQKMIVYISNLAVPARRSFDEKSVLKGKYLFTEAGCASCHIPKFVTGTHPRFANLSAQTIRPYTDLLLHDMGEALADGRPDFLANGKEWRTQPLWGIGLVNTVNNHTRFLHDGRARSIEEAILWHGGEAEKSKKNYVALSKDDRQKVLAFLNSL